MLKLSKVETFEVVLVNFSCWLEDSEVELVTTLAYFYFVYKQQYFAYLHLIFVVIAYKLLVYLPWYLSQIAQITVGKVEISHIRD